MGVGGAPSRIHASSQRPGGHTTLGSTPHVTRVHVRSNRAKASSTSGWWCKQRAALAPPSHRPRTAHSLCTHIANMTTLTSPSMPGRGQKAVSYCHVQAPLHRRQSLLQEVHRTAGSADVHQHLKCPSTVTQLCGPVCCGCPASVVASSEQVPRPSSGTDTLTTPPPASPPALTSDLPFLHPCLSPQPPTVPGCRHGAPENPPPPTHRPQHPDPVSSAQRSLSSAVATHSQPR